MMKKVYIGKVDKRVHKYNNTYNTNKKKPIHINSGTYIVFYTENHYRDPKFKFDGHVRIS